MASTIKVDNVQNQPGTNIINKCSTTITIGASSDTVTLACGASQTGFGRTGTVDWQTGSIKTATFTAVSGNGYFCNTTGGVLTVNLPAGSAGDIVGLKDYAGTWDSNAVTLAPNGSEKIGGDNAIDPTLTSEGGAVLLVYVDGVQGWLTTAESVTTSPTGTETFLTATVSGACNTLTTVCTNYKLAKFVGPGTFCVSATSNLAANNLVSYAVVAGGGGGGGTYAGGGGAGGFREYKSPVTPYTASPLDGNPGGTAVTVSATGYPIDVGGGGPGGVSPGAGAGISGSISTFSTIDSAGGGAGAEESEAGTAGGSGGGGSYDPSPGGAGNTPPTTPAQGFVGGAGGPGAPNYTNGGGGGALEAGVAATPSSNGRGGVGTTTCISGSPTAYAGGGGAGGGDNPTSGGAASPCGTGGAGTNSSTRPVGYPGAINTGGGGGGNRRQDPDPITGGSGGSGIVMIRYKFQ